MITFKILKILGVGRKLWGAERNPNSHADIACQ